MLPQFLYTSPKSLPPCKSYAERAQYLYSILCFSTKFTNELLKKLNLKTHKKWAISQTTPATQLNWLNTFKIAHYFQTVKDN